MLQGCTISLATDGQALVQAMASAIGHPFWQGAIANMVERAFIFDRGANYATVAEGDWETNILWRVGESEPPHMTYCQEPAHVSALHTVERRLG